MTDGLLINRYFRAIVDNEEVVADERYKRSAVEHVVARVGGVGGVGSLHERGCTSLELKLLGATNDTADLLPLRRRRIQWVKMTRFPGMITDILQFQECARERFSSESLNLL
jgi:hypothetical protein